MMTYDYKFTTIFCHNDKKTMNISEVTLYILERIIIMDPLIIIKYTTCNNIQL